MLPVTDNEIMLLVSEVEAWEERPLVRALDRTGSFGQRMAKVSKHVRWIFEYLYGSNCCGQIRTHSLSGWKGCTDPFCRFPSFGTGDEPTLMPIPSETGKRLDILCSSIIPLYLESMHQQNLISQ